MDQILSQPLFQEGLPIKYKKDQHLLMLFSDLMVYQNNVPFEVLQMDFVAFFKVLSKLDMSLVTPENLITMSPTKEDKEGVKETLYIVEALVHLIYSYLMAYPSLSLQDTLPVFRNLFMTSMTLRDSLSTKLKDSSKLDLITQRAWIKSQRAAGNIHLMVKEILKPVAQARRKVDGLVLSWKKVVAVQKDKDPM